MKDSGIEWIGEIPEKWKVGKIKYIAKSIGSGTTPASSNPEYYENGTLPWIQSSDLYGNNYILDTSKKITNLAIQNTPSLTLQKKDFLVLAMYGSIGSIAISKIDAYTNQACCTIKTNEKAKLKFLYYYLKFASNHMLSKAIGSILQNISQIIIKNLLFLIPPLPQQQAIADFLDDKCAEIDNLSSAITEQIEVLKQYKKSVITEAVTKGLDPNAPMKDSGVEWIGMIPEKWELKPFEHILQERSLKNNPIITSERLALSIDKGITLYSEKTTNLDRFKDDVSLYKVVYPGDFVMNSMNMIVGAVGITPYLGCVSPAYYVFYDNDSEHTTARFCDYIFHSKTIRKYLFSIGKGIMAIERGDDRVNTCRLKVSRYDLNKLKLPQPSINEQRKIVNYLDDKCAQIDSVIKDKETQLETLAAYKKSLIYEYVTGKKEVPQLKEV